MAGINSDLSDHYALVKGGSRGEEVRGIFGVQSDSQEIAISSGALTPNIPLTAMSGGILF